MLRFSMLICAMLLFVRTVAAVDGVAVSAQWVGGNDNLMGGFGNIVKYHIKSSLVQKADTIYKGAARYATINTEGTHVAFIKSSKVIAVVGVNGGSATDLVTLPSANGYLDWPTGRNLYYSKGGYGEAGSKEVWKVNIDTKSALLVHTFNTTMWQWGISNDAAKACVRPSDGQDGGGTGHVYRYVFSTQTTIQQNNSDDIGMGCGNSIAPSGSYMMRFDNYNHNSIAFHNWDKSQNKRLTIGTMNGWGKNMGSGWNRNRWSSNSDKWICTMQGWDGRTAGQGSNQVLYNWVDGEQVVVSNNAQNSKGQNEAGDFWSGTVAGAEAPGRIHKTERNTLSRGALKQPHRGILGTNYVDLLGKCGSTAVSTTIAIKRGINE